MYYLNTHTHCKLFLKKLLSKNQQSIKDIQSKIRDNQNIDKQVIETINYNLTQIKKNPCLNTFNKHNVKDFFLFYNTLFNHHKEQYLESNKCRNRTYDILAFIDRFNSHLKDINTKLNK